VVDNGVIKPLSQIDQQIFRDPVGGKELIASTLEAFRSGVSGAAFELKLLPKIVAIIVFSPHLVKVASEPN